MKINTYVSHFAGKDGYTRLILTGAVNIASARKYVYQACGQHYDGSISTSLTGAPAPKQGILFLKEWTTKEKHLQHNDVELEPVVCENCHGTYAVDFSYIDQVSLNVSCPMCHHRMEVSDVG